MKKVIKENRILFILAIIIIIALVLIGVGLISYFYGNDTNSYGDRLKDKDKYPLKSTLSDDIKSLYTKGVNSVKVDVKGKIIYIIIDVEDGTSKIDAEGYAVKSLEKFTAEELDYYDIQFMVTSKNEKEVEGQSKIYPIAGAKKAKNSQVIWTNN